jgi:lactate dehydrogenase-like 2-hydroxyacid dehydrogenase
VLACRRRTTEAERYLRDGSWEQKGADLLDFWGNNPEGKTLGIIGCVPLYAPRLALSLVFRPSL